MRRVLPVFTFAHFTLHVCMGILIPLLPLLRDHFQLDYFRAGLLFSAYSLVYGFAHVPIAAASDRWEMGKRTLISLGLLGVALTTFGIGLSIDYHQVLFLLAVMGFFGAAYHPLAASLLSQIAGRERTGRSLGIHIIGGSSSFLLTPIMAGSIASLAGWRPAFLILAAPAILASFLFWRLVRAPEEQVTRRAALADPGQHVQLREIVQMVGIIVAIAVITQAITSGVNSFLPLYLVDKHGVSPVYAGMIVGVVLGSGIVAGPLGGTLSDRFGRKPLIVLSVALTGPLLYLVTLSPYGPVLIVVMVLYGITSMVRMPVLESMIADIVPWEQRATFLSFYYFLVQETGGVVTPAVGYLIDQLSLDSVFAWLALVAIGSSGLAFLIRRKV